MEIAVESKTPIARTRFKDNLVFKTNEPVIINSTCSQITRALYLDHQAMETSESCVICLDEDIESDLMFLVGSCGHRFCLNCVKQHIQVKLLDVERYRLVLSIGASLGYRIKEESMPLNERVYCPYQSCSHLMSKTELFSFPGYGYSRRCFQCGGSFCVYCKGPWHGSVSCADYKRLYTNPRENEEAKLKTLANLKEWRQCPKCQHITCRCGNGFCYRCGCEWNSFTDHRVCITRYYHEPIPIVSVFNSSPPTEL
ncbi:unnamed protein product [Arabis nemorensis]|uniref:RBR-type E3 ubiquitin transferase n=1 Tax=Arabis nemorensis TaxID=586526 RepID=A0A565CST1_9BRAS|nr:unnamed protein product [Arabis nemorensis]